METIADNWKTLAAAVVPKNAGAVQRSEMERMFFSGCQVMLNRMMCVSADDVSEDDAVEAMEIDRVELETYFTNLAKEPHFTNLAKEPTDG